MTLQRRQDAISTLIANPATTSVFHPGGFDNGFDLGFEYGTTTVVAAPGVSGDGTTKNVPLPADPHGRKVTRG